MAGTSPAMTPRVNPAITLESVASLPLIRHARACRGHPRLHGISTSKTWMAGTSPAMTLRVSPAVTLRCLVLDLDTVMPGFLPGILGHCDEQDVDGRDKPGHDAARQSGPDAARRPGNDVTATVAILPP